MTDPRYVLLRADQVKDALDALKGIESYAEESNVDHYLGAQKVFTNAIRKALVEDGEMGDYSFMTAVEELAKRHDHTVRHEGADIDRRIVLKAGPIFATVEEEHVLYDVEPVRPERPSRHFTTTCHNEDERRKEYGKDTNVVGSGYCIPSGHAKTIRAISLEVLEGSVDGPLDVNFFFACTSFGHTFKIVPGEVVPVECKIKRTFPKDLTAFKTQFPQGSVPDTGFFPGSGDDTIEWEIRDADVNEIKLMPFENFYVEVSGVKARALVKLNLHGPYYSSHYGKGDLRKVLPLEPAERVGGE